MINDEATPLGFLVAVGEGRWPQEWEKMSIEAKAIVVVLANAADAICEELTMIRAAIEGNRS